MHHPLLNKFLLVQKNPGVMPNSRTDAAEYCLLPTLVERIAQTEPEALWGEYPKSSASYNSGFGTVPYSNFANAVDGVAHFIQNALLRSQTSEILAYLAPNGPQCAITFIATMKAGFQVVFALNWDATSD